MAWSVLLQAAIPVTVGLALAIVLGTALGTLLMRIGRLPIAYDWGAVGLTAGAGAVIIATVTALTLPLVWRHMSASGLRVE